MEYRDLCLSAAHTRFVEYRDLCWTDTVMLRLLKPLQRFGTGIGGVVRSFFTNHPTLSFYALGFGACTFSAHQYIKFQTKSMESAVYEKIEMGTRPPLLRQKHMISREKTAEEIVELFFPKSDEDASKGDRHSFGLIIGPTGTGKTCLVTNLCNKFPKGVIYYEVVEPKTFSVNLSKALSMKTAPSNIFDLLLSYLSSDNFTYYRLSDDQEIALDTIFQVLKRAASKFQMTHGQIPTLFIDGADLLAKYGKELFGHLVAHAKAVANANILTVVFVSSEGSILPIVSSLSGISRCSKVFEIIDISDKTAIEFLISHGLPSQLSTKLVSYVGGRFVYLLNIVDLHKMYRRVYPGVNDELVYKQLLGDLFSRKLAWQHLVVNTNKEKCAEILCVVSKQGELVPSALIATHDDNPSKKHELNEAISVLVDSNVLRYTKTGSLAWHGRPQQYEFKGRY